MTKKRSWDQYLANLVPLFDITWFVQYAHTVDAERVQMGIPSIFD